MPNNEVDSLEGLGERISRFVLYLVLETAEKRLDTMKPAATILDFDRVYEIQTSFKGKSYEWIDVTDLRHTNGYCDFRALAVIRERLKGRKARPIAFFGTGNYHYVTHVFLSDIEMPFTLVLFDHHTDLSEPPAPSITSCGAWVATSLQRLPLLRHVVIIGADPDFARTIPSRFRSKVSLFPEGGPDWQDLRVKRAIISAIPTPGVYISIDKDVLRKPDAITDWDQGSMKLEQLLDLVKNIMMHKDVRGLDIGGEYPLSLARDFGRCLEAARVNERANRRILTVALRGKRGGAAPSSPSVSA
ncbi:MAG: hypothetical protein GX047_06500 [Firmicutes bacterium]|nr:hypothetical protein [Bacillota bacterium]